MDLFLKDRELPSLKWMHYFPIYERYFQPFKEVSPTVVEFGCAGGGSLEIWREYFGESARIIGVDINPKCKNLESHGFEILIGDQGDSEFLAEVADKVAGADIVIDDGGHTSNQMISTFREIYPVMSKTGVYIAEDTHAALWPRYVDRYDGLTFLDYAKSIAEKLTWYYMLPHHNRFRMPLDKREGEMPIPQIAKDTFCVTFYNSIVAFERSPNSEPLLKRA